MMMPKIYLLTGIFLMVCCASLPAQREYASQSVLSSGNWYKIGITRSGIHKIDFQLLAKLGIPGSGIASSSIKVYGNGGLMLSEKVNPVYIDDLQEVALQVIDGNDGILDAGDFLLFYGLGPESWRYDSVAAQFQHTKNLFSDTAYYYITTGTNQKRIQVQNSSPPANREINSFLWRHFIEKDSFNFLSSGKEWFGDEFAHSPGKIAVRDYLLPVHPAFTGEPGILKAKMVARSFGVSARFSVFSENSSLAEMEIPPVATGPYDIFAREGNLNVPLTQIPDHSIQVRFDNGSTNAQGWPDWLELLIPAQLALSSGQLSFRNDQIVEAGSVARFTIDNAGPGLIVWDVTDIRSPVLMNGTISQGNYSFTNDCSILREYSGSYPDGFFEPVPLGRTTNQNLHGLEPVEYLIISHPSLITEANRLAVFHSGRGLTCAVVSTDLLFNEFSSGIPDPSAIRDFVKMFYDRAGQDTLARPDYLLLFGAASFDYKHRISNNTNLVPAFESSNSLDPLSTYTADDFFGFLEDGEDINTGIPDLDISIGRIPATTPAEAKVLVDKIIHYHQPATLGSWRNELTFIADDEDANLHLEDAELISQTASEASPDKNIDKIYLDAYQQESSPSGNRYPQANQRIANRVFGGTLFWNYNGHGGNRRLAEEVILDQDIINGFKNPDRLPLFIVATCDFAPFDNPLVQSIGEKLLFRENGGAIALMSTTRLVFAFSNRVMNNNYIDIAIRPRADGSYRSLGAAAREAKNLTYQFFGDVINNRKFTLLGDPALTLAFPKHTVRINTINGNAPETDTLKALSKVQMTGEITTRSGERLTDFTGTVYPVIFDKEASERTLGNDAGSNPVNFNVQRNIIYKGKASVENGLFNFEFIVPRDIRYEYGRGKISLYAENGIEDASGEFAVIAGGTGDSTLDKEGPQIKAYLNDAQFINGGIVNEQPILLLTLTDSSGINISGIGIGHDLVAYIDNDPANSFVLNDHYEADKDDYKKGSVRYQLPVLLPGLHTLTVKAWDIANNPTSASLDFQIVEDEELMLKNVLNYPNPFTTRTNFWFDHNRAGDELHIQIQIFTVTGKLVKTIRNTIFSTGNRSNEVFWDGRDDFGQKLGRGVYIYSLAVRGSDGKLARKVEKLYLL